MDFCLDGIQTPKVLTQSSTVVTNPGTIAQHGSRYETGQSHSSSPDQDILKDHLETRDKRFGNVVVIGDGAFLPPRSILAQLYHASVFDDNGMESGPEHGAQFAQPTWSMNQEQAAWLEFDPGCPQRQSSLTAAPSTWSSWAHIHQPALIGHDGMPTTSAFMAQAETSLPFPIVNGRCFEDLEDLETHTPAAHLGDRPEKCPIANCDYRVKGLARTHDLHRHSQTKHHGHRHGPTSVRDCLSCRSSGGSSETEDGLIAHAVFRAVVCDYLTCAKVVLAEVVKAMTDLGIDVDHGHASLPGKYRLSAFGLGGQEGIPATHNLLAIQG